MDLAKLLERVEPSQLRKLGTLFEFDDDLPIAALIDRVVQELPFCETEEGGECVGIDGAYFVVADLVGDMTTLDLLLETEWTRREPNGVVTRYRVDRSVQEMSLADARLLLALLSIATSGEDELGIPPELSDPRLASRLRIEQTGPVGSSPPRPSQRPSQMPGSRRPSIPPGFSPTLESVRPKRASVPPKAAEPAAAKKITSHRDLVELVLTLPRNSMIAAAFALSERGSETHAVSVGNRGRVVLRRDQLGVIEQLFLDVSESIPQLGSPAERDEFEKQLAKNITFYGVRSSDAAAVVSSATETGRFPEFYSDERPPPLEHVRGEFSLVSKRAQGPALQLLYDVFYRHCCATVQSLGHSLGIDG